MLEKRRRVQVECPTAVESLSAYLLQWLAERAVSRLGFYRPIKSEPDLTEPLLTWKLGSPQRCLCVPVVDDSRSKTMHYARWDAERVRIGCYGIEEPVEGFHRGVTFGGNEHQSGRVRTDLMTLT